MYFSRCDDESIGTRGKPNHPGVIFRLLKHCFLVPGPSENPVVATNDDFASNHELHIATQTCNADGSLSAQLQIFFCILNRAVPGKNSLIDVGLFSEKLPLRISPFWMESETITIGSSRHIIDLWLNHDPIISNSYLSTFWDLILGWSQVHSHLLIWIDEVDVMDGYEARNEAKNAITCNGGNGAGYGRFWGKQRV